MWEAEGKENVASIDKHSHEVTGVQGRAWAPTFSRADPAIAKDVVVLTLIPTFLAAPLVVGVEHGVVLFYSVAQVQLTLASPTSNNFVSTHFPVLTPLLLK